MENNNEELQYINLIKEILEKGIDEITRNGNTYSIFGSMMKFSLINGKIPILTTKKVAIKTCFEELMWFIKGNTDNNLLQQKNVKIWNDNSTREFLDSQDLFHLKENDLGPVYGHQWRYFNAEYIDCNTDYKGKGIDQLNEMALPPCHIIMQFKVRGGKYLSCAMY